MGKVTKTASGTLICDEPDHDVSTLRCGAPIPCPYHTPIVDIDSPHLKTELEFIANKKRKSR